MRSENAIVSRFLPCPGLRRACASRPGFALAMVLVVACGGGGADDSGRGGGGAGGGAAASGAGASAGTAASGAAGGTAGGAAASANAGTGAGAGAGAGADAGADADAGAGAGTGADAGAGTGAAPAGAACAFTGETTSRELGPLLFGTGADPSAGAQCRELLNPERGLFVFRDLRSPGNLSGLRGDGYTLIYGKVLIDDYRERDLDVALLDQLKSAFASVRQAGLKVLPRIYYADDGDAPDAPLERVLAHIEQLTPLLRDNADVIAVLHPGFVGAWGEWHASTNGLTETAARKRIFDALLAALPEDRMTLSRRPSFKQEAYGGPLDASTMFDGSARARVGHLNDCFLASDDDVGTYQRAGEREYAVSDSAFVPVGGETCGVNPPRSECASALEEMALLHWSFLNTSYHPEVIAGFRSGGCYEQIACRLGYRFVLLDHASPRTSAPGAALGLRVRVLNDGFARMYNPRPVEVVLDGPVRRVLAVEGDPRTWAPGEAVELCLSSTLPADLPAGSYRIGLRMPDAAEGLREDARYAVRIANAAEWDAESGTNWLEAEVVIAR